MTLRHLKIFLSVCQNHYNTTKAAEAMHMTQPAVSLAIRELEDHYEVPLFDRMGRRLKITAAGERFLKYAIHITTLFDDMEQGMLNWNTSGELRVGASFTIGSLFLPGYVKKFQELHPETRIRAIIGPTYELEQKLLENSLDFALIEGLAASPSLICEPYKTDSLSVIFPADCGLEQGSVISQEFFRKQNFLLRECGSGTREVFNRATENAGFAITPLWEAMSTTALINAVISGIGVSVLPWPMVKNAVMQNKVIAVSVENMTFQRFFQIVYHKEKYLDLSARLFIDLCRSQDPDIVSSLPLI